MSCSAAARQRTNSMRCFLFAFATALLTLSPSGKAAENDWPCVQRRVGELTAAQMWDGPALETAGRWREDPAIAALAAELAQRRMPLDDAAARIDRFAAGAGQ